MKKNLRLFMGTLLTVSMTASMVSCGSAKAEEKDKDNMVEKETQTEDTAKEISGDLKYAMPSWHIEKSKSYVEYFEKLYPNVNVEIIGYDGDLNEWLTAQAATGTLPDVVYGWNDLIYPVSQGWLQPLDEFLVNDDDIKYVAQNMLDSYNYNGNIYALPAYIEYPGIMVNKDLLNELNLDDPGYEWTLDEFIELAKKATTDKTSGVTNVGFLHHYYPGMFNEDLGRFAYSENENAFKFTDPSWIKAVTLQEDLMAVPGLVADSLRNQEIKDAGKEDDYEKKFGKDVDGFVDGKVLFASSGIWDGWLFNNVNFDFDMYPLPQDATVGYRHPVHVDHAFMTSTQEDKSAAFELLKFVTYDGEGVLEKLKGYSAQLGDNGVPDWIVPATNHPKVDEYFTSRDYIKDGVKYIYKNLDKSFTGYYHKTVPGFRGAMNDIINPTVERIVKGEVEAPAIAAELEEKANKALDDAKADFNKALEASKNK